MMQRRLVHPLPIATTMIDLQRGCDQHRASVRSAGAGRESDTGALQARFGPGDLTLRTIADNDDPALLEKLVRYEAVHRIEGARELRRRLQHDRAVYALFHPALPDEPLIFTEVALTTAICNSVIRLIDPDSPIEHATPTCAVFYSISNCHDELKGLGLGNALLRAAIDHLCRTRPSIQSFATLSPVPGFRTWLEAHTADGHPRAVRAAALLAEDEWISRPLLAGELRRLLPSLCAEYLLRARRGAEAADPVARFHLGNGASLDRVNWLGDATAAGLRRSAGLAVNYRYSIEQLPRNQRAYAERGVIAASTRVRRLALRAQPHASC